MIPLQIILKYYIAYFIQFETVF